ncbi:hypothetical protein [Aestuariimicrobium ganziense]|uniref:hypothetical protein n=1 Tax=Aestuariimicrobium ganziense TaxID=2773677 RepID=UPI00194144E7|nr:hypothetical protein [Aestuariimicrobium ganziense]
MTSPARAVRAGLAVLAMVAIAACGNETARDTPTTTAPVTSAAPSTSAPQTSAPETSAPETSAPETSAAETSAAETSAAQTSAPATTSASATSTAAAAGNACELLTVEEFNTATGSKLTTAKPSEIMGSSLCTYSGDNSTIAVSQITATGGIALDSLVKQIQVQFQDSTVVEASVPGASEAVMIQGKLAGAATVDLVYIKDGSAHQVILSQQGKTAAQLKPLVEKAAAARAA